MTVAILVILVLITSGFCAYTGITNIRLTKQNADLKVAPRVVRHSDGPSLVQVTRWCSPSQDQIVLEWDFTKGHSTPWTAVNEACNLLYSTEVNPYYYVWWNDDREQQGVLLADAGDLNWDEVNAICKSIKELNQSVEMDGDWRATTDEFDS